LFHVIFYNIRRFYGNLCILLILYLINAPYGATENTYFSIDTKTGNETKNLINQPVDSPCGIAVNPFTGNIYISSYNMVGGVCDLKYIKLQEVQDGCRTGSITDVGNGMNPDIEKIIDLHPDAIMLSPFENSGGYGRVEKLNIPIIECADYMETSALGRAEWMRFYGLLFGEAQKADSLFAEVEKNYNELKALVAPLSYAPSVISELKNGSAWYVPGGKSTSARIYADAGANYVFADDEHSGSVPLAFETVFDKGQNADFWLIKYNQAIDKTYKELEQDYAPYTGFRAFKERNIYGCNTGKVDFYEDSPFHPDRLLKDLIKIFHPTLLEGYELKYFTKLAE
jgi:iron complex transport system substrate-binding protein